MKKLIAPLLAAALGCGLFAFTGCQNVPKVDPTTGTTTVVKQVDPVRIQQIRDLIEPGAAEVLSSAIAHSPQHAEEIKAYANALKSVTCQMQSSGNFSVDFLVAGADQATAQLQAKVAAGDDWTTELVRAKRILIGVYKAAAADDLSWKLPNNLWLQNVTALICDSITDALKSS